MGENTRITWTDHTFNRWWGCTMVTDACINCYASTLAQLWRNKEWPKGYIKGSKRSLSKSHNIFMLKKWDTLSKADGRNHLVFAHSMSDVFDLDVPDQWRLDEFDDFAKTEDLYFQVLTKRSASPEFFLKNYPQHVKMFMDKVWLGTSIGSDKDLEMAHEIVKAPALLHWISYEPAIGPLNVYDLPEQIKWLVIGGESGHGARPFNIEWALNAVEACKDLGVSVFVKQLGLHPQLNGVPYPVSDSHGKILSEWPEALRVQDFPL